MLSYSHGQELKNASLTFQLRSQYLIVLDRLFVGMVCGFGGGLFARGIVDEFV
jgi:hypothetical protein